MQLMYTLLAMRAKGNIPPFRDLSEEVPWAEFVHYPGEPMSERIDVIRNVSLRYPFNIIKSHASPPAFKIRDDVKYLVAFRNVHDMVASLHTFFANHQAGFAKVWGGFPPGAGGEPAPEPEYRQFILLDAGDGKPFIDVFAAGALKAWWPYRKRPNVLFLHYSDRIKNDVEQLERIKSFLNLDLTPAELKEIAHQVTFQAMKKDYHKFEMRHFLDSFKSRGLFPANLGVLNLDNSALLHSGPARKGDMEMSKDFRDAITKYMSDQFPKPVFDWVQNGGPLPDLEL